MYLKDGNPKLFQPPRFDKWTPVHTLECFITTILFYVFLTILLPDVNGIDWSHFKGVVTGFVVWVMFLFYDVGQAHGYKSEEGVDPLDLLANTFGITGGLIVSVKLIGG